MFKNSEKGDLLTYVAGLETRVKDLQEMIEKIEKKLIKIDDLATDAMLKASASHSLIVVRKVSESNLGKLKKILE